MLNFFTLIGRLFNTNAFGRYSVSAETERKIKSDWQNIDVLLKNKGVSQLKQALITADKTLDNALRDIVAGDSMGERLKNSKEKFDPTIYNKIWEAHKVRNNMVHEAGYEPPHYVLTEAVDKLRLGLSELHIKV